MDYKYVLQQWKLFSCWLHFWATPSLMQFMWNIYFLNLPHHILFWIWDTSGGVVPGARTDAGAAGTGTGGAGTGPGTAGEGTRTSPGTSVNGTGSGGTTGQSGELVFLKH